MANHNRLLLSQAAYVEEKGLPMSPAVFVEQASEQTTYTCLCASGILLARSWSHDSCLVSDADGRYFSVYFARSAHALPESNAHLNSVPIVVSAALPPPSLLIPGTHCRWAIDGILQRACRLLMSNRGQPTGWSLCEKLCGGTAATAEVAGSSGDTDFGAVRRRDEIPGVGVFYTQLDGSIRGKMCPASNDGLE